MRVKTKRESHKLLKDGLLGNRLRVWNSVNEILDSGYRGNVSVRYKGGVRFFEYDVPVSEIPRVESEWEREGAKKELMTFNETPPDHLLLMQGELALDPYLYYLFYSLEKKSMREALEGGRHANGLVAKTILEHYLSPSSYSDMQALLDMFPHYPDHVIEFSAYSVFLGSLPGRNAIIWEVRSY
jgi:hypothetical protein